MHIPIELRARIELRVDGREEVAAKGRRDVFICDVVEGVGEGYFVEVQGQRAQLQRVGDGLDVFDEVVGAVEGEGVMHRGDWWVEVVEMIDMRVRGAVSGETSCGELEGGYGKLERVETNEEDKEHP